VTIAMIEKNNWGMKDEKEIFLFAFENTAITKLFVSNHGVWILIHSILSNNPLKRTIV
jgi:hypothetical protein